MAGITAPTAFLVILLLLVTLLRSPYPLAQVAVFPMAVVPNLWGLWNMLYCRRPWTSIGVHGALLALLLVPTGFGLARWAGFSWYAPHLMVPLLPVAVALYYLAWKYLVGFLNEMLGVA
jgi:hypothetical protein